MKIKKEAVGIIDAWIDIINITLLSVKEYEVAKDNIPVIHDCWWLRSPGRDDYLATGVYFDEGIGNFMVYRKLSVRPVLRFYPKSTDLLIGNKVRIGGCVWTNIGKGILLCDQTIARRPFKKDWTAEDSNNYETSDVKAFLDKWLEDTKGEQKK